MQFRRIDIDNWDRKEYYLHYLNDVTCSYALSIDLDITRLRGQRLYPAMLWLLTDTVNEFEEFRTHLSREGLGIFDSMHPSYTIFNQESKKFSVIHTEFDSDYPIFLQRYMDDVQRYQSVSSFMPKPSRPENCFDVSMLPWVGFRSFQLQIYGEGKYLLPIFTMGKYFEQEGKRLLPLAVQVHHAVCDGYHVGRFLDTLQEKIMLF